MYGQIAGPATDDQRNVLTKMHTATTCIATRSRAGQVAQEFAQQLRCVRLVGLLRAAARRAHLIWASHGS